jgi:hypothetical protein
MRRGIGRQPVVEPEGAANREGAVSDVVDFAGGPFFLKVVNEERADFEGGGFVGLGVGGCVWLGVGHLVVWAEGQGLDLGNGAEEQMR